MIIQTVNEHDFRQAFIDYNRGEQFTYDALTALFEWLEELAEDTGTPYELDVIALCCEFTEYTQIFFLLLHLAMGGAQCTEAEQKLPD